MVAALRAAFGDRLRLAEPLAPFTTFKLGGPAKVFVTVYRPEELRQAVTWPCEPRAGHHHRGGSNLLIADQASRDSWFGCAAARCARPALAGSRRCRHHDQRSGALDDRPRIREAWKPGPEPGTVGGAIYGNAHFQGRNISEYVDMVCLLDRDGAVNEVPAADIEFAHDYSRLHRTGEIVMSADFRVTAGDPEHLRAVARESLAYRKRTQPLASPSAGCIFQNPTPEKDSLPAGVPWSAGALVDRAGLKGAREGQARVSPTHGNFIVNEGGASERRGGVLIDGARGCEASWGWPAEEIGSMGSGRAGPR